MKRNIRIKVGQILRQLQQKELTISTAESCTGGGIAAALTSVSGSSAYVKGGVVAYWNEAKQNMLNVSELTIARHGVVSEEVVREMAFGALQTMHTDLAVSTSGVTGPTGGTPENPVCTVWMAVASSNGRCVSFRMSEEDQGRTKNTENAVEKALDLVLQCIENEEN